MTTATTKKKTAKTAEPVEQVAPQVHPHIALMRGIAMTKLSMSADEWNTFVEDNRNDHIQTRFALNGMLARYGLPQVTAEQLDQMLADGTTPVDIAAAVIVAGVGEVVAAAGQEIDLDYDEQIDVVHDQAIEAAKDIADALGVALYVNDEQVAGPKKPLTPNEIVASGKLLKVSVPQKALAKALSIVSPAASTRTTLPVLQHFLLTRSASNNTLRIAATNLEVGITCAIPLPVSFDAEDGAATLPVKLFTEFVSAVPSNEEIALDATDEKTTTVKLQAKRHKAVMNRFDPHEFPTIAEMTGKEPGVTLDAAQFRKLISGSAFAAAKDPSRPVFNAVNVEFLADRVVFVAADSFRLAVQEIPLLPGMLPDELVNRAVLIPATSFAIAERVLPQSGKVTISIASHGNQVYLVGVSEDESDPIVTVVSNLIVGQFPNYRAIMPLVGDGGTRITISRDAMRSGLKGTMLFARDSANIVRLSSTLGGEDADEDDGTLTFAASADEVGEGSVTYDTIAHDGPPIQITVNGVFLRDVIDAIDGDIAIYWSSKLRPFMLKAVSGSKERVDGFTYVVMPMHNTKGD